MKRKAIFLAVALVLILTSSIILKNLFDSLLHIVFGGENGENGGNGGDEGEIYPCSQGTVSPEGGSPPHTLLFKVSGAADTNYLSNIAVSTYDGHMWRLDSDASHYEYHGEELNYDVQMYSSFDRDTITITPLVDFSHFIPTSIYTTQIFSPVPLLFYSEQGIFYSVESFKERYSFTTIHYSFNEYVLKNAEPIEDDQYLQLPETITDRTRTLAYDITKGDNNPYEKAKAIEKYLKNNYEYDAKYNKAPSGWEPIDWFLFEERKGVCANFNSAFVVMCRCVGIPTRLVSGFSITSTDEEQAVYADQAHAWAEVGFEKLGWIAFDATGTISGTSGCCEGGEENGGNGEDDGNEKDGGDEEDDSVWYETFTKITFMSSTCIEKGQAFFVMGRVYTKNNEPVNDMPVVIYLNKTKGTSGMICGEGETENGIFNITCTVPIKLEVSYYQVIAHSLGIGRYLESWSDPKIKVVSSTHLTIDVPGKVEFEKTINIRGVLTEKSGAPITDHAVRIYVNRVFVEDAITDEYGQFSVNYIFDELGEHTVEAKFLGTKFHLSSNVITTVEVTLVKMGMLTNPTFIRGETVELCGRAWTGGNNLTGEPVLIAMDNETIAQTVTDEYGTFNHSYLVKRNERLGGHTITYRLINFNYMEEQSVIIKARTFLNLTTPDTVLLGENFTVYVALTDNIGNPVPNAVICIQDLVNTTDIDGVTSFRMNVPQDYSEEKICVETSFAGEGNYLPSRSSKDIRIQIVRSFWLNALLPFIVIGGLVGGYFFWRRRKKNAPEQAEESITSPKNAKPTIVGTQQINRSAIEIIFPQIENFLPDVWGLNESLQIKCSLIDEKGNPITGRKIKGSIGDKTVKEMVVRKGKNRFSHKFDKKGEYEMVCRFEGDSFYQPAEKKRPIRIVDYREEIISLFNSFLTDLRIKGIEISEDETPREVQRKMLEAKRVNEEALEKMIRCFEEAQYSTHSITRKHYITMFLSLNQVKEDVE